MTKQSIRAARSFAGSARSARFACALTGPFGRVVVLYFIGTGPLGGVVALYSVLFVPLAAAALFFGPFFTHTQTKTIVRQFEKMERSGIFEN